MRLKNKSEPKQLDESQMGLEETNGDLLERDFWGVGRPRFLRGWAPFHLTLMPWCIVYRQTNSSR
jgi:hypothetical protein